MKQELAGRLAATMMDVLGFDSSAVSVAVEVVPMQNWMQQVYGPHIKTAGERLLKRPGYGPLASPLEEYPSSSPHPIRFIIGTAEVQE